MNNLRIDEVSSGKSLNVADHARLKVQASPGEKYYLVDETTGQTPQDLEVFRKGDALHLRSAQYDVEVVIEEFWEACSPGSSQCFALFDTPEYVGGELVGQAVVTQEGEVLGALLAGEIGTLAENAAILGVWGGLAGTATIIPALAVATGALAAVALVDGVQSPENNEPKITPPPRIHPNN